MALLPLLDELYDAIPNGDDTKLVHNSFRFLTPKIINLIVAHSQGESVAYFETDYFGGNGDQGAVLAKEGKIIFGPQSGPGSINAVLKLLKVAAGNAHDEFDAVGLGRFRDNEDWIEQPTYGRPVKTADVPKSFLSKIQSLFGK